MSIRENPEVFIKNIKAYFFIVCIFFQSGLSANLDQIRPSPIDVLMNPYPNPSFVNSVDFHPEINQFCVTFTHNDSVVIYQLGEDHSVSVFQVLQNPLSKLSYPASALFSKDGRSLVAVNWLSQTFNVYLADLNGVFQQEPIAIIPFHPPTDSFRPHGMAFSPDGNYLVVAYGVTKQHPRAVALYQVNDLQTAQPSFKLLCLLQGNEIKEGIPKGIAFSPDGSCILVTFSNTNSVTIYQVDLSNERIISTPRQILSGISSLISRPEDIKFTADGNYCAVSNSNKDTITFYLFDRQNNYFVNDFPSYIMKDPNAELYFPHGLAFSSDGNYLAVTQFGLVIFDSLDNLTSWGNERKDSVGIYKLN